MISNVAIIKWYNKWPEWLRWILFLPISLIFSIIAWFIILRFFLIPRDGDLDIFCIPFVINVLHPAIVQMIFLFLVFLTVPRGKLICVKILIILRSLVLIIFITQPIINFMGAGLPYDIIFFKDFIGEILTLAVSTYLFKELKKEVIENKNLL